MARRQVPPIPHAVVTHKYPTAFNGHDLQFHKTRATKCLMRPCIRACAMQITAARLFAANWQQVLRQLHSLAS